MRQKEGKNGAPLKGLHDLPPMLLAAAAFSVIVIELC